MSFSTGFKSTRDDSVNAERAAEVGIEMEINLDGQSVTSTIWMSSQRLKHSSFRKISMVNKKIYLDSLKLFNRLIIFAQRDMTVETSLRYELTRGADSFPKIYFFNSHLPVSGFPTGVGCQHFKTCSYTPIQTYW